MEYTKNYKLPQWVETDQIQMEDFNEAMENIDKEIFSQGELSLERLEKLWNGVIQVAALWLEQEYNAMDEAEVLGTNLYLNPLANAEMASILTNAEWNESEKVYIGRRPELPRTYLRSYSTKHTYATVNTTYNESAATALYEFTAPRDCIIHDFDLRYYFFFSATNSAFSGGSMTFTAYENHEGSYAAIYAKSGITLERSGTSAVQSLVTIPVEVRVKKGHGYRLSLHVDSGAGVLGRIGLCVNAPEESDDSQMTVAHIPVTEGSHTKRINCNRKTTHATAKVLFRQEEGDNGVAVSIDGYAMEESSRTATEVDGMTEYELTFYGSGDYSDAPEVNILMQCGETDRLQLLKYGVFLL